MEKELEALKYLKNYLFNEWKQNHINFGCDYKLEAELEKQLKNLDPIKQALLKAQELEGENAYLKKVLSVIWEKTAQTETAIAYIKMSYKPTYEDYCSIIEKEYQLTKEEFEALMRCNNDN